MTDQGEAPWDGETMGGLQVRGPWVAARCHDLAAGADKWSNRRLVSHRRRGEHRRRGLRQDHRPHQGPDQVRRRVDQFGRSGSCSGRTPGDRRGRGDIRERCEMGRASVCGGGAEARHVGYRGRTARVTGGALRQIMAARRLRPRRGNPAHVDRQDAEGATAGTIQNLAPGVAPAPDPDETRVYVQSVLRTAEVYRRLFSPKAH